MENIFIVCFNIVFDFIFSIFVVNNLVVFTWRIIWDTQDLYLLKNLYLNSIISLAIGSILTLIVKWVQIKEINMKAEKVFAKTFKELESQDTRHKKIEGRKWKKFKLKMFIFIFSFANINNWRGIWNFTLIYTNYSVFGIFTIGIVSLLGLFAMRRVCALVSIPFFIFKDNYQNAYRIQPTSANHNYYLSIKDSFTTKVNFFKYFSSFFTLNLNKFSLQSSPNNWQFFLSFVLEYLADCFTIQSWRSLW